MVLPRRRPRPCSPALTHLPRQCLRAPVALRRTRLPILAAQPVRYLLRPRLRHVSCARSVGDRRRHRHADARARPAGHREDRRGHAHRSRPARRDERRRGARHAAGTPGEPGELRLPRRRERAPGRGTGAADAGGNIRRGVHDAGVNEARSDDQHRDWRVGQFHHQNLGQAYDGML